ncbi:MAG: tetratricopeptide repeat protein [Bacteroidetes bacterium]|nr:MAG: tetratricopeptide repeat protein [Bacteroidota bacterium]
MTFYTKTGTLAILASGMLLAACTNVKKAAKNFDEGTKYQAEPEVLELHGDSVEYTVTIQVDPKKLDKKATVDVNPTLEYGDQSQARPQVTVQGEKAKGSNKGATTIQSKSGGKVTYKDKFKYQPEMKNSELKAKPTVMIKGYDEVQDQCINGPEVLIAKGIVTTHELAENGENVLESGDPYVPIFKNVSIELYYLINSSSFNPNFRVKSAGINNKDQLTKLKELGADTVYLIKGITINGFASPDGELKINEKLSGKRAESTFNYLKKQLKKLGFSEVNDSAFSMSSSITEDWDGWKMLVESSDLADKSEILSIMNSNMSNDAKEAEIKRKHAKSYNQMKNDMLPLLRRATINFNRQQPLKTDAELQEFSSKLNELQEVELMQLARLTSDSKEKARIYQHCINTYPNSWKGYNNLAYVHLMGGNYTDAMPLLEKAKSIESNQVVLNNMGVAYAMQKDYDKAEEMYKAAKAAGENENMNMGMLEFRKGNYEGAITYLANEKCEFNTALTYLMKGDYSNAKASLDCVKNEDKNANYYYLSAILGARTNNLEAVTSNLTRSIQLDAKMRDAAKADLEFRRVRDRAEFQNAIR